MNERTQDEVLLVDDFRGVNSIIDEVKLLPGMAPQTLGGYCDTSFHFNRLPGKILHSSDTTGGHVLSIRQLEFTDHALVIVHDSSDYRTVTDMSTLTVGSIPLGESPVDTMIWD